MNELKTGIVYDEIFLKHNQPGHPENAKRLESIMVVLKEKGLHNKVEFAKTRQAEIKEILLCHSEQYVLYLKTFCEKGGGYLDPDTYSNEYSFKSAAVVLGSIIDLTNAVIKGELKNGFALVRPPGHHALSNKSMGFCLFGNISIAATAALIQPGVNKVAIVDFDVHHGNGTQALVADNPNILFISTHQYPFYPGTGSLREIGKGEAEGTVVNIPLPSGAGDSAFKSVYEKIVVPSLDNFNPDMILVSAGYDAHQDDPLANLSLSLSGFNWISGKLVEAAEKKCSGKIIFFLEGGYNLKVLAAGVTNSICALMGEEAYEDSIGGSNIEEPDISNLIGELKQIHGL